MTHTQTHTCMMSCMMEYYFVLNKKETLPCVKTRTDLKGVTLFEISQSQKDKYCIISLYVEYKIGKLGEAERMLITRDWEGRGNGEKLVKRYKISLIR